ncbi:MAG: hypothetical protein MJ252_02055 [archaeon]|nr:hypothetical protein [archaeon]
MGAKKKKKGGKKKKQKADIPFKYEHPDLEELMKVPCLNWQADLDPKNTPADGSNYTQECSKTIKGKTPMDYSFNKIKEEIQKGFGDCFGNLILFLKDETGERRELKDDLFKPLSTYLEPNSESDSKEVVRFIYDFEPFVHPMLEASVAMAKEKIEKAEAS